MLVTILILFGLLFLASFFLKIDSLRKVKILNHTLATVFLLIWIFSVNNLLHNSVVNLFNLFHIESLENYFLLIFAVLWFAVSFYSDFYFGEYLKHWKKLNFYYIMLLLFVTSMLGVIISSEAITFLVFWEIMSVSSYFLVVHEATKKWILKDWAWYLIITHIWMFFILLSFIPFIISTHSTSFLQWWNASLTQSLASLSFFAALIWFGSKAWLFPIHIWLPKAHPIAPTNVSALMSWFMVKLPVLMILKFLLIFFHWQVQFSWFVVTLLIAAISSFLWVFYAIIQHNIKKLLAYHTIENVWIIFLGIAISMLWMYLHNGFIVVVWIFAALYHTFNHAIFKWLLFLVAGWMIERTNTYEYTKLGWLIKTFPFLALSFLVWSIAIAWVMPLNGFNSEFLTFVWLFKSVVISSSIVTKFLLILSVVTLTATAVLSLICFTKVFWIAFLGNKRDISLEYKDIKSIWEKISYWVLMLAIVLLAVLPGFIYLIVSKILNIRFEWNLFSFGNLDLNYTPIYLIWILTVSFVVSYILYKVLSKKEKKMPVWNCGYNYIEPKTQYTSTAFIQPLRRIFASIYGESKILSKNSKKESEIVYKKELSNIEYSTINKYFVDNFYAKVLKFISSIAKKVKSLQNWEIQSYIFYMFLALLLLVVIVLFN